MIIQIDFYNATMKMLLSDQSVKQRPISRKLVHKGID